jgi:predicted Rossmann fold nucleotide-binding protein DprA/Smf involved in DNA uptake
VLAWAALPFVGERTLLALLDHAREGRRGLADLWQTPLEDLRLIVPLHPKAAAALEERAPEIWDRAAAEAEAVRAWGVDLLLAGDPEYPAALREAPRRWPVVFAYGALALLEEPRAAIVNSRAVTNQGLAVTDAVADALARRDVPLVASINREAYQAAAIAAKRHAGPAVLVLDRGIAEAFPTGVSREPIAPARVWDESFDPDLQLLLSPFPWKARWNPRSGPRRDELIFDLADVVLAVDVSPGGTIDRECRLALQRDRPLLALDRGDATPEGTRGLWEQDPRCVRLRWSGGETAAESVLRALPGGAPAAGAAAERSTDAWRREVGQFLARACAALDRRGTGAAGAFPTAGPFAPVAARWSRRQADGSAGVDWLLADLALESSHPPARVGQLLERVSRGGLLGAVVPVSWLQAEDHAGSRASWLSRAALRLAARLPAPPQAAATEALAAVVLERDGAAGEPAPVFTPQQERMGRFHLRRYLQEVLAGFGRDG